MSGELKVYDVRVGGTTVQMKLSEADARRRGVWQEPEPAPKPAPKRKTPAKNKKVDIEDTASGGE